MGSWTDADSSWSAGTYDDVADVAEKAGSIVVIPLGSVEQHGHHLPVSTDTLLTDAIVRASVERVAGSIPVVATPPVWTGYSPHHLDFGGTLSVGRDTFCSLLDDVADSALDNGFDGLLFVNGHGGNGSAMGCAVSAIGDDHPDVEVSGLTYPDLAAGFVDDIRDSDTGGMAHAGEFETSLMLHCYPDRVRTDRIEGTPMEAPSKRGLEDMFVGGPLSTYIPFEAYSESGAVGEPTPGNADKGEALFGGITKELADVITGIHERATSGTTDV